MDIIILRCNWLKIKIFSWFDFYFPPSCSTHGAMPSSSKSRASYREVGLSLEQMWSFSIQWTHSFLCITLTNKITQWIFGCEPAIIYCLWRASLQSTCSHTIPYKRWTWAAVCFLEEWLFSIWFLHVTRGRSEKG